MKLRLMLLTVLLFVSGSAFAHPMEKSCDVCGKGGHAPYGSYCPHEGYGPYGRRMRVHRSEDAVDAVRRFYAPRPVAIGRVAEKRWFFRVEVLDELSRPLEIVIIDKRNGRIRSIY